MNNKTKRALWIGVGMFCLVMLSMYGFIAYNLTKDYNAPVYHYISDLNLYIKYSRNPSDYTFWFSRTGKFDSDTDHITFDKNSQFHFYFYGTDTIGYVSYPKPIESMTQRDFHFMKEDYDKNVDPKISDYPYSVTTDYRFPDYSLCLESELIGKSLVIRDYKGNKIDFL